jgi:hypothetical protein
MSTDPEQITMLKLSVQRALLGQITSTMAAVYASINATTIALEVSFFSEVSSGDVLRVEEMAAEVIADFPEGYDIETSCSEFVGLVEGARQHLVYLRAEAREIGLD